MAESEHNLTIEEVKNCHSSWEDTSLNACDFYWHHLGALKSDLTRKRWIWLRKRGLVQPPAVVICQSQARRVFTEASQQARSRRPAAWASGLSSFVNQPISAHVVTELIQTLTPLNSWILSVKIYSGKTTWTRKAFGDQHWCPLTYLQAVSS